MRQIAKIPNDIRRGVARDNPAFIADAARVRRKDEHHPGWFRRMIETIAEKLMTSGFIAGIAGFIGVKIGVSRNAEKLSALNDRMTQVERRIEDKLTFIIDELRSIKATVHDITRDVYKPRWDE